MARHQSGHSSGHQPITPELYSVVGITRPDPRLLGLYALRTLALCLLGPWFLVALIPLYFKYKTLRYRFDDEGVTTSWGLLWHREIHLTYARVQDIHVSRGLLERWLGLATIHVQTASGNSGAEMSLVGLTDFELIRDFLYSRMRGTEEDHDPAPGKWQRAGSPTSSDGSERPGLAEDQRPSGDSPRDEGLALLESILDEVQRLRRALELRAGASHAPDPDPHRERE
jgi:putative membrane protein